MMKRSLSAIAAIFLLVLAPIGAAASSTAPGDSAGAPSGTAAASAAAMTPSIRAAVPSSFRALSVTFASPSEGWVLGSITCSSGRCPALAHTLNAGRTWSLLPGPATTINPDPGSADATTGVSSVRFANSHDGWVSGPELWATHDGGHTWTRVSVYGAHAGPVVALEAARGTAYAVLYDGASHFRIATTPVGSNDWRVVHLALEVGAGPVPEIQLVLSGSSGWVLQNDRTVVNGARLVSGTWVTWHPACASTVGPAQLAAADSTHLFAVCDVGLWSTPAGEHLYRSSNGGTSFVRTGSTLPTYPAFEAAAASRTTIAVTGVRGSSDALELTFNGGVTWHRAMTFTSAPADLGFTTASQGVLVSASRLWMTRDGGHSWSRITF